MPGGVEPWRTPIYTNAGFAEEQRWCYELKLAGYSLREIADITGLSKSTVDRRLRCEISDTVDPLREQYKRLVHDRLEKLWKRTVGIIAADHYLVSDGRVVREVIGTDPETGKPQFGDPLIDHGVTLAAIGRGESILKAMADLHGLKAPMKVDATVTETTQHDLEVIELINTARAKEAADAARLGGDAADGGLP